MRKMRLQREMKHNGRMSLQHRFIVALAVFALVYSAAGLAFHVVWKVRREVCDELRRAQGAFVEPEVFPVLGVAFTTIWWPVYAWANVYHSNELFPTPCSRQAAPGGAP
jgi:hypothetical protein